MSTRRFLSASMVLTLFARTASAAESIGGMVTQAQVSTALAEISAGHQPWTAEWAVVLSRCSGDLGETPSAVASLVIPTFSDDPSGHDAAKNLIRDDVNPAFACAIASAIGYNLSAPTRQTYSDKAQELIDNWASTNTSVSGSGSEPEEGQLVFAYVGSAFMTTAELLSLDASWDAGERATFTAWVDLVFDAVYADIQDRSNNWGSWASLLGIGASRWKGNASELTTRITRLKAQLDSQIDSSGGLPLELGRSDGDGPIWYTYFSLAPLTHAAYIVRNTTGEDLFVWAPPTGGTLGQALGYFYTIVLDPTLVGGEAFDLPSPTTWAGQLLFAGGMIYGSPTWVDYSGHPTGPSNGAWKAVDLLVPQGLPGNLKGVRGGGFKTMLEKGNRHVSCTLSACADLDAFDSR